MGDAVSFAALALALASPLAGPMANLAPDPTPRHAGDATVVRHNAPMPAPLGIAAHDAYRPMTDIYRPQPGNQVRVQQRVIIRIAPRPRQGRTDLLARLPSGEVTSRFAERDIGQCVSMKGIAGVQSGGDDRLLLFMKDRRIVSARLDRSCQARDFYSGFYIENPRDGKLCVGRDVLQARSGARCSVGNLARLIRLRD